ncbi:uncharacterized protein V6R79_021278 [Siganus canaliculatus]
MGTKAAKATTPVAIVEKRNPLIKGIAKFSTKWNKRWAEIDQPWPPEGTFDPEVIKTLQVLISTYKAEQKKGKQGQRRKEKRDMETAVLELFNQEGQKLLKVAKDRMNKNMERNLEKAEEGKSKPASSFSHMTPVAASPPPYEKDKHRSLYPQLPFLTTEGRYSMENEDSQLMETGRAKTTIVLAPETKSKKQPKLSSGPFRTSSKGATGSGKDGAETWTGHELSSNDKGKCIGGYDPAIKKILARAERKGQKGNREQTSSDSDSIEEESAVDNDAESDRQDDDELEKHMCRIEEAGAQIHSMEEDLWTLTKTKDQLWEEMWATPTPGERQTLEESMEGLQRAETKVKEKVDQAIKKLAKAKKNLREKLEQTQEKTQRYQLRPRSASEYKACPVLVRGQNLEYKPWANTDMTDIMNKLPNLQDGAHPWISRLEEALVGTQPAMGDIKRLFASLLGVPAMEDILERAGLQRYVATSVHDPELLVANKGLLWRALRDIYPTNVHPDNILIDALGEKENPRAYVARALLQWRSVTGRDPEANQLEQAIVRDKIQQGLPLPVRSRLAEVVGLSSMTKAIYTDHIAHQVELYRKKQCAQKEQDQETLRKLNQIKLTEQRLRER